MAEDLAAAVSALRAGRLVLLATDTVYGLAARALDPEACRRLNLAKGRPAEQPLLWLVSGVTQARRFVTFTPAAQRLARRHWPGAVTLVLARRPGAAGAAAGSSQGVRRPDHPQARALLAALGEPLAASSANRHGEPPASSAREALEQLGEAAAEVAAVLDGHPAPSGLASTIIDLTSEHPRLLRSGPGGRGSQPRGRLA